MKQQQTSRLLASALALGLLTSGCGGSSVTETERAKWEAAGITEYTLTYDITGGLGNRGPKTVQVSGGAVTEIISQPENSRTPDYTVEDLFDQLDAADIVVDVEFDPELGYPTYLALNPVEDAIDDEFGVTVLLLEPNEDN